MSSVFGNPRIMYVAILTLVLNACDGSPSRKDKGVDGVTPVYVDITLCPNLSRYRTLADTVVELVLGKPIDTQHLHPRTVYLTEGIDPDGRRIESEIEVQQDKITVKPLEPLRFGVPYKVWISSPLTGLNGEVLTPRFPAVTYGATNVPAPGDIFVVNIPNDLSDMEIGQAFPLLGYIPPLLDKSEQTDPAIPEHIPGISATEAWKLSTGRPDVLVVILDNGLSSYATEDLSQRLFLNRSELPLPRDMNGQSVCERDPSACKDPYDFNRDGRFNCTDYQDAGYALAPHGSLMRIEDSNANERIDPGDLIEQFQDGIDGYPADPDAPQDTGGLVDDISGYDFLRDVPVALGMPAFPEGTHGEGRALEVAGEADNGSGVPGVCPNCTVMVCRITYGLIQEGELLSHALRYAVDKGAQVIVAALGSLSGTASELAALRYADAAGVPVIVGMSDESSFHHSAPSMFDHVIAVKCNYSFFVESFCTGYGGQVHLATAGECGSTACGIAGGAAGLLISRARDLGYCRKSHPAEPACVYDDLSANEVKQILTATAEKPSDPRSCFGILTDAPCKIDTWDRHQGYGRINLFRALQYLEAHAAPPPAVQITSPGWFALLRPELSGTALLGGTISSRVPIDRMIAAWAPGIEPDEADFRSLMVSQPAHGRFSTTLPLEEIARSLGGLTATPRELEGKSFTVRVQAFSGDVKGEDRRVFTVHRDPSWVEGFPIALIDKDGDGLEEVSLEGENAPSIEASPALADLDGDGKDEIVVATSNGQIHVLSYEPDVHQPIEVPGYPIRLRRSASINDGIAAAPAVGDIDRDGYLDIVVATLGGCVYAFRGMDGAPIGGPLGRILCADVPANDTSESYGAGNSFFASPVLTDLNNDGYLDVVAGGADHKVYAVDGALSASGRADHMPGWPVDVSDPDHCSRIAVSILGTPVAADLTGDGRPEIIVGTSEVCARPKPASGRLYALHPEGNLHPNGAFVPGFPVAIDPNPLGVSIPLPPLTTGIPGSPVAARVGDEVVISCGTFLGPIACVYVHTATGAVRTENLSTLLDFSAAASAAFSRTNDGELLFALPMVTIGPTAGHGLVRFINHVLLFRPERSRFPVKIVDLEDYAFLANPSFVDVDGDGSQEVVIGSGGYFIHAYTFQGAEPEGWPKFTYGWHMASPAFGDIDGDGSLEMVAPVREGRIFAWNTTAPLCANHMWQTFHHDNMRTGFLETSVPDPVVCSENRP